MTNERRIKGPKKPGKLQEKPRELDYPALCFRHLTTNNKFLISKIRKPRDRCNCYDHLFLELAEIQGTSWVDYSNRNKVSGMETFVYDRLKFNANNIAISKDAKIISIRFGQQNYRILAYRNPDNNVLHIIGYDLNFNAYDHGS